MKMYYRLICIFFLMCSFASCEYLDIVPDERPTDEDAFEDQSAAYRYLYSCYSFIPSAKDLPNGIDFGYGR